MKTAMAVFFTALFAATMFGQTNPEPAPNVSVQQDRVVQELAAQSRAQQGALQGALRQLAEATKMLNKQEDAAGTRTEQDREKVIMYKALVNELVVAVNGQQNLIRESNATRTMEANKYRSAINVTAGVTFLAIGFAIFVAMRKPRVASAQNRATSASGAKAGEVTKKLKSISAAAPEDIDVAALKDALVRNGGDEIETTISLQPQNITFPVFFSWVRGTAPTVRFKNDPSGKMHGWEKRRSVAVMHLEWATQPAADLVHVG